MGGPEAYVYANAAAAEILGTPAGTLVNQRVEHSYVGDAFFSSDEPSSRRIGGSLPTQQGELLRRDGRRVLVRWTSVPTRVGEASGHVHLLQRAERHARAEQALFNSEQRFRKLIDTAPDGILVLVGSRIAYANQAITLLHGYTNSRQLSHLSLARLIHADDLPRLEHALMATQYDAGHQPPFPLRALRRDGRQLSVEMALLATEWDLERAVLVLVRDLTGRRELQNQLVQTDRLAAVGTLAAGVAHEINNPLAYVLLNLQYLLRELPKLEAHPERRAHLLERVREARHGSERVATIVRDLRTFSRSDHEQIGPVDLRRVLSSAIKVARAQLLERGHIVEHFEEVPLVRGNAPRLEQVFLNLLVNAIQSLRSPVPDENVVRISVYMADEHAGLQRETERPSQGTTAQREVVVEISDTGGGIPAEHLGRVFDPFFTTKPVGLGTGLGLPICHSIVNRMGGSISVESEVGLGSKFFVTLPVSEERAPALHSAPTPAPMPLCQCLTVLVLDDEPAVASMIGVVLEADHEVIIATHGREALLLLEQRSFDVVLCDLLMPEISGMDFFQELGRRHPEMVDRVVFMTGGAFTPRAADFLAHVENPRIEKPFDVKTLRRLIREVGQRK